MLLNFIAFDISWVGLVLLGSPFIPIVIAWICLHIYHCKYPKKELKLILTIATIGLVVDLCLQYLNVLIFPHKAFLPLWLVTLWFAFGATISHSLSFLTRSKKLQAVVGFIFPPLSYIGGSNMSSVELGYSTITTFFVLGLIWAGLLILFFQIKSLIYRVDSQYE